MTLIAQKHMWGFFQTLLKIRVVHGFHLHLQKLCIPSNQTEALKMDTTK